MGIIRPSWQDIYLTTALVIAQRSHDTQTKVGCVITSPENIILGTGYNGFPAGIKDDDLPTTRPGKYKYVLHAEKNGILNCSMKPVNGIAYITGAPCYECLKDMWQYGIRKIVYLRQHVIVSAQPEDEELRKDFVRRTENRLEILPVELDSKIVDSVYKLVVSYQKSGV